MQIAIFGTGGAGGYFGGRLAQAGEEVVFIARGEHLQALQTQGLRVDSVKGDFSIPRVRASDDPAQVGIVDVIIVGVKAWQVPEAAQAMRPMVGPETFVVPLQNGVDAPSQLAATVGAEHILGGLCRIISFVAGPGHIRHVGGDPYIAFGELNNHPGERAEKLHQAFARAEGVMVEIPPDILTAMWQKFLLIASWSGVGAITRAPIGALRTLPETRRMLEEAMQEILDVAQARQIALSEAAINHSMGFVDGLPFAGTASMQRDIMEGRPSELASQNGAVVRLGQEVGVATPLHAFIYHSLLPLELQARGLVEFGG
jgi:2-dehydropantoate 2-reductase